MAHLEQVVLHLEQLVLALGGEDEDPYGEQLALDDELQQGVEHHNLLVVQGEELHEPQGELQDGVDDDELPCDDLKALLVHQFGSGSMKYDGVLQNTNVYFDIAQKI